MDLEGIIISELSQTEKRQILYDFTSMWNLKNKKQTSVYDKKVSDPQIKRTNSWLPVGKRDVGAMTEKGEKKELLCDYMKTCV